MSQDRKRGAGGFTLVEMLVVLVIAAILLAVGVPSFTYMVDRNRVAGEVNEMLADLALTRSEALARRGRVIICRSGNPTDPDAICDAGGDWNAGWIVFIDNTTAGTPFQRDTATALGETIIRAYTRTSPRIGITPVPALAGLTVTADGTVFLLDGTPIAGSAEPLRIDFAGADDANKRSVCIATTGRARTSATFGTCS